VSSVSGSCQVPVNPYIGSRLVFVDICIRVDVDIEIGVRVDLEVGVGVRVDVDVGVSISVNAEVGVGGRVDIVDIDVGIDVGVDDDVSVEVDVKATLVLAIGVFITICDDAQATCKIITKHINAVMYFLLIISLSLIICPP
jgi:hypothetical protein